MKRMLALLLVLALPASQSRLFADEAPELPKSDASGAGEAPAVDSSAKAEVAVPEGEPEAKKSESVEVKHKAPSRFRWGNFLLGALGGAAVVGAAGILGFAQNSKGGIDYSQAGVYAACGAVGGGVLSWLLGATTEPDATPPDLKSSVPAPGLQAGAKQLVFTLHF